MPHRHLPCNSKPVLRTLRRSPSTIAKRRDNPITHTVELQLTNHPAYFPSWNISPAAITAKLSARDDDA